MKNMHCYRCETSIVVGVKMPIVVGVKMPIVLGVKNAYCSGCEKCLLFLL